MLTVRLVAQDSGRGASVRGSAQNKEGSFYFFQMNSDREANNGNGENPCGSATLPTRALFPKGSTCATRYSNFTSLAQTE